jgi:hypothetical protein
MKVGDKLVVLNMAGYPSYSNKQGIITSIRSDGFIFGTWGSFGINPRKDEFRTEPSRYVVQEQPMNIKEYTLTFESENDVKIAYDLAQKESLNILDYYFKTISFFATECQASNFFERLDAILL